MKKTKYIKPQTEITLAQTDCPLLADSWGTDGSHEAIVEGDPTDPLDSKENNGGYTPWED